MVLPRRLPTYDRTNASGMVEPPVFGARELFVDAGGRGSRRRPVGVLGLDAMQPRPMQGGPSEVGAAHVGAREVGVGEVDLVELGAWAARAGEVGLVEVGAGEVCVRRVHLLKDRLAELGPGEPRVRGV